MKNYGRGARPEAVLIPNMRFGGSEPFRIEINMGHLSCIDLFRGVIMFLLIAEATGLYELLAMPALGGTVLQAIGTQFHHHHWNGLRLWDLGQPMFMFISGAAMYVSYSRRWERGGLWKDSFIRAVKRAAILFILGWAIYRIVPVEDNPQGAFLYDMLPQLAVGSLIAFLVLSRSVTLQLSVSFGLIALTEVSYRLWAAAGSGQPFAAGDNFGAHLDRMIWGSTSGENWVSFNMVPLAAVVIWGALAGRLLRGQPRPRRMIIVLAALGWGGILLGLGLGQFTPIIRRIATSSFVVLSGGACFLAMALAYWLMDFLKIRKGATVFLAVGMNPIFIYLFAQTGGAEWLRRLAEPFTVGLAGWAGLTAVDFATALAALGLMWGLCYWLYRRKIFIRI